MKTLLIIALVCLFAIAFPKETKKVLTKGVDGIGYVYHKAVPVAKALTHKAVKATKEIAKN